MGSMTIGVEEEFFVVDPRSHTLVPDGPAVLERLRPGDGEAAPELHRALVETSTPVLTDLGDLRTCLATLRKDAARAAGELDRCIVAAGTVPLVDWPAQRHVEGPRNDRMVDDYQQLAREQLICGFQTHVGLDRETAVSVLTRVRPWLPVLLALSTSSPYWSGTDTGYASYRTSIWSRWPTAGIPEAFASAAEYDAVIDALIAGGTITDAGMIYWDARASAHQPTLEFRIADACTSIDDAVLLAGLCRGLARGCADAAADGRPPPAVRTELLTAAKWRAARSGLEGPLLDVLAGELVPPGVLVDRLLTAVRPALEQEGDWDEVAGLAAQAVGRGTSARRQRAAYARAGEFGDVVDLLVGETCAGGA